MTTATAQRIAILIPNLQGGGAERVCVYLANEFVHRGFAVDLILTQLHGELFPLLDSRVMIVDLEVARFRRVLPGLIRYLHHQRPDAVLANMWPLTPFAVLAQRLALPRCRTVLVEHSYWSRSAKVQLLLPQLALRPSMRLFFPWASARVAVSEGAARDLESFAGLAPNSVTAITNPVTGLPPPSSTSTPKEVVSDWATGPHQRLISVGSLKPGKGFEALLKAFSALPSYRDTRLLILGEGAERPSLERLIARLGLTSRVFLPGFVLDPRPFLAAADLFVLASEHEGFGNVIAEALEQGCPVVSTDCPSGPREILDHGRYGTLVPVGDIKALTAAIDQALSVSHDPAPLKRRAFDFSIQTTADAYLDLLCPGWQNH